MRALCSPPAFTNYILLRYQYTNVCKYVFINSITLARSHYGWLIDRYRSFRFLVGVLLSSWDKFFWFISSCTLDFLHTQEHVHGCLLGTEEWTTSNCAYTYVHVSCSTMVVNLAKSCLVIREGKNHWSQSTIPNAITLTNYRSGKSGYRHRAQTFPNLHCQETRACLLWLIKS